MECVDELSQDSNKYFNYMRQAQKQTFAKNQYIQKRVSKNAGTLCPREKLSLWKYRIRRNKRPGQYKIIFMPY